MTLAKAVDKPSDARERQHDVDQSRCGPVCDCVGAPACRLVVYAPAGRAAYPSTVLMAAVPARVAGVRRLVVATPPGPDSSPNKSILAAARIAGVDTVYRVGGAQAIAALAFGTETVERV